MLILLATAGTTSDNAILFQEILEKKGVTDVNIAFCSKKSKVMSFIEKHPETDVIVLSQYLENESFTPKELDDLSIGDGNRQRNIIVTTDQPKGSSFVSELEKSGIYNAIFNDDATEDSVAERIIAPYDKAKARAYYRLDPSQNKTERFNTGTIQKYLHSYNDFDDLRKRMSAVEGKLSKQELVELIKALDDELFNQVSNMEQYRVICDLVSEQRKNGKREGSVYSSAETIKKNPAKKAPLIFGNKEKKKRTAITERTGVTDIVAKEIAFVSSGVGVGCTHTAIMCAVSLAQSGDKVAIIEFDNEAGHFDQLSYYVTGLTKKQGQTSFSAAGVDFFYNISYRQFATNYKPQYKYVVFDLGFASVEEIKNTRSCFRTFVVGSNAPYRHRETDDFLSDISTYDLHDQFIYLFPTEKAMSGKVSSMTMPAYSETIEYEPNVFNPSPKTVKQFRRLMDARPEAAIKKRPPLFDIDMAEKAMPLETKRRILFCVPLVLLALCTTVFGILKIADNRKLKTVTENAVTAINACKETNEALEDRIKVLEADRESLKRSALILKEPVSIGMPITADMIENKTVYSDLPQDKFLEPADLIGHVAAINMTQGSILYDYSIGLLIELEEDAEDADEETTE